MGVDHYENFPVASWALPTRLRAPIRAIYAFARTADDIADEGDVPPSERLAQLVELGHDLDRLAADESPRIPEVRVLAAVVHEYRLPLGLFRDLLSAFSQDVTKQRYANFAEVMDYCRRSANPIGRLLLHLYGASDARNLAHSDAICSSLQLINFLQDVAVDYHKGRVYLPQDEMMRYGVEEAQIARREGGEQWRQLMLHQIERAQRMLHAGAPLGRVLNGRVGLELRMVVLGANRVLAKLRACDGDVFRRRPVLERGDWARMVWRALLAR